MKKRAYILFAILASAMMMVVSAVPHHHHDYHDGMACILSDITHEHHCDNSGQATNTNHHDTPKESCASHGLYTSPQNEYADIALSPVPDDFNNFLILAILPAELVTTPFFTYTKKWFKPLLPQLPLLAHTSANGLRAPPSL